MSTAIMNNVSRAGILAGLLTVFTCHLVLGHNGHPANSDMMYKAEMYWQESGLERVLNDIKSSAGWSDQNFSLFVYHHKNILYQSKLDYFAEARKVSDNLTGLTAFWVSKTREIRELFTTFRNAYDSDPNMGTNIKSVMHANNVQAVQSYATNCDNVGLENGNYDHWEAFLGMACYHDKGSSDYSCNGFSSITFPVGITENRVVRTSGGYDPLLGGTTLPMTSPFSSSNTYSLRLENYVNGADAAKASYDFTVSSSVPYFVYSYAVVLEDPGSSHPMHAKPFFGITIFDHTDNKYIDCATYEVFASPNDPDYANNFDSMLTNPTIKYKGWTRAVIPLSDKIGHNMTISFIVSDCPWGGHLGYAYIDAQCWPGNFDIGNCKPDGTRDITAPDGFIRYLWRGDEVIGSNGGQKVNVKGTGPIICRMFSESKCIITDTFPIGPCTPPPVTSCSMAISDLIVSGCDGNTNYFDLTFDVTFTDQPENPRLLVTDGRKMQMFYGPFAGTESFEIENIYSDGVQHTLKVYLLPDEHVSLANSECYQEANFSAPTPCLYAQFECEDCVPTFHPTPGETYVISAWVRDPSASPTDITYTNPKVVVSFDVGTPVEGLPSGPIIDGWQRIYQEFTIPSNATEIKVKLTTIAGLADFDDVRIFPVDGHMKAYVYDPETLRLVAILDENNYATYYEYDNEGNLVRTKRETTEGIVTLSENRQSNPK